MMVYTVYMTFRN